MTLASTPASRWAVSARTNGEVLTAGIVRSELELVVLGVPSGFSQPEIEGWLHDLAGVAVETSRADSRSRAIPALMHHTLTGLLFSHAELWDRLDPPQPSSCAFIDLPDGATFGWVGDARVHVLVDGDPVEPQWVRVRDDAGREARAAVFAPGSDVVVTLEYWPDGGGAGTAPASIEAEWMGASGPEAARSWQADAAVATEAAAEVTPTWTNAPPDVMPHHADTAQPHEVLIPSPVVPAEQEPLPESLPMQQPGLAVAAAELPRELEPAPMPAEVSTAGAFESQPLAAEPAESIAEPEANGEPLDASLAAGVASFETTAAPETARTPHPVARWLAKVMRWGKRPAAEREPQVVPDAAEGTPVSAYDSLLSESVPATALEQTQFELAEPEPRAAEAVTTVPEPVPAPPARAGLQPAGLAEILGAAPQAPPAPAGSPPSASLRVNERLQALLREIEEAEAARMPVVSPQLPEGAEDAPLEIDHEPVGADESFGIPPLPASHGTAPPRTEAPVLEIANLPAPQAPYVPPADDRIPEIPPLPTASAAPAATPAPAPALPELPSWPEAVVVVHHAPPSSPAATQPPPMRDAVLPVGADLAPADDAVSLTPAISGPRAVAPPPLAVSPAGQPARPVPDAPPMLRVELPRAAAPEPVPAEPAATQDADSGLAAPAGEWTPAEANATAQPAAPRRAWTLEGPERSREEALPWFRRPAVWAAGVVGVFLVGWLLGGFSNPGADRGGPVMAALRAIGIGGAHFTVSINSSPGGAQIEIDGKPQATRTPATLELPPGEHVVKLLLPSLGDVTVPVKGRSGEKLTLDEPLDGSLEILDTDSSVPITVAIDGKPSGYAPLRVEKIAPGLHEVQFSGPGMPAWAQTVQVDVRGSAQLIARPMSAPANGIIQAQATLNDERGASPLNGAQVYIDGELRGVTPLSLELPRGPHSLRVTWRGETAPVQVIDLPGGNQRFASFNFGLDIPAASVALVGTTRTFTAGQAKVVSAQLLGLDANDVNEAWLRARTPEGVWRRYAMTLLRGPGSPVVTSVFPDNLFDRGGNARWYVSVSTKQGDEYFSELQQSSLAGAGKGPAARPQP